MIRGISYSRPLLASALVAFSIAGVLSLVRLRTGASLAEQRRDAASAEQALRREVAGLSAYENVNLEALRRRASRFRERLGTDGTWETIVQRLGSGWVAESGPREDRSGFYVQPGTLTLVARAVDEWPGIVDAVRDIEAVPGAVISGFEMKASGGDRRSLDKATIQVEIQASHTETNLPKKP
jgi:hypothetical protein